MRIEGFVLVDPDGKALWQTASDRGHTTVSVLQDAGWTVVRVGDVDSIRDEALDKLFPEVKKIIRDFEAARRAAGEERIGDDLMRIGMMVSDRIRAMKSKP